MPSFSQRLNLVNREKPLDPGHKIRKWFKENEPTPVETERPDEFAPPETPTAVPELTDQDIANQALNQRFGNDMAWLDEIFQAPAVGNKEAIEYGGLTADPETRQRRLGAADEMFKLWQSGGLGPQDLAAREKNRKDLEGLLRGNTDAVLQDMAERGMSGSGTELAALLSGQQAAGARASAADLQTSADAEKRAMDALISGEKISGDLGREADDYVAANAKMLSDASNANKKFLQDAWSEMMDRRNEWDINALKLKLDTAGKKLTSDQGENKYAHESTTDTVATDTNRANTAKTNLYNSALGAYSGLTPTVLGAQNQIGQAAANTAGAGAQVVGKIAETIATGGASEVAGAGNKSLDPWEE